MALFRIDEEKCQKDGICADACPMQLIEFSHSGMVPSPVPGAEDVCINCGHCLAVCPHGALSLEKMKVEECRIIQNDLKIDWKQAEQYLLSRRSIRTYKAQPLDDEDIKKLIAIATQAPSGHNSQPVSWLVIKEKEEVKRLSGVVVDWMRTLLEERSPLVEMLHLDKVVETWDDGKDRICRGAPHVIVAHAHKDMRTAPASGTIALTYLELAAFAMGLGACWAGFFNLAALHYQPMLEALQLPKDHIPLGSMMVGRPKYKYHRIPKRNDPVITWR